MLYTLCKTPGMTLSDPWKSWNPYSNDPSTSTPSTSTPTHGVDACTNTPKPTRVPYRKSASGRFLCDECPGTKEQVFGISRPLSRAQKARTKTARKHPPNPTLPASKCTSYPTRRRTSTKSACNTVGPTFVFRDTLRLSSYLRMFEFGRVVRIQG
ncbi:hypothetical protein BV22DRAFT_828817 [Leucogyrophana mollusca]|uniref:Uncharacterized protein n=1 Tax=Leucogyrophana mollusca TaxID=85980 RepID=A0ACB8B4C8_9AGAM|nr:hypothetical protein BV22DRAFT_828817 [Leucogyrophana mollusca]